jgi:quinol monooxygenase YgiN
MFVTSRFRIGSEERQGFLADAERAVEAFTAREGCLLARVGQSTDAPEMWALTTVWSSVGAYRRALSSYQVKLDAVPLLYRALDEPSAYAEVIAWDPQHGLTRRDSPVADEFWVVPGDVEPSHVEHSHVEHSHVEHSHVEHSHVDPGASPPDAAWRVPGAVPSGE